MSQPRFVAPLGAEVCGQLDGLRRRGRRHRVRQRAHAVRLSAKGYPLDQIADVLAVDRDAVSRTLDRWKRGAWPPWRKEVVRAAPPKVDAALAAEVLAAAQERPASLRRTLAKRGRCEWPATPR